MVLPYERKGLFKGQLFGSDPVATGSPNREHGNDGQPRLYGQRAPVDHDRRRAPSGVLASASGQRWTFHGWIDLAAAIEQWRATERRAHPSMDR
jgi:hypothetical protein